MRLLDRFRLWVFTRHQVKHSKWLRRNKVVFIPYSESRGPDRACQRNKVQSL